MHRVMHAKEPKSSMTALVVDQAVHALFLLESSFAGHLQLDKIVKNMVNSGPDHVGGPLLYLGLPRHPLHLLSCLNGRAPVRMPHLSGL